MTRILKRGLELPELERQLENISQACKVMGFSQNTFSRCKELYENGGEEALLHEIMKKKYLSNRVSENIESAVIGIATEFPKYGQGKVAKELKKRGIKISSTGVRCVQLRNNLETREKRIKALEVEAAKEGTILTAEQCAALERAKERREANGEIDAQDI